MHPAPDAPSAPPPAAAPYRLPRLPHLRLSITLRAEAPADLPPFHGSLLRGAFGHALRAAVCAMGPAQPCATCRLRRECIHPRLFETLIEEGAEPPPFLRGLPTAPRPYVFEPAAPFPAEPGAAEGRVKLAPGDPLGFDLLLFGQAVDLQAHALLAIERMAAAGLGSGRVPFTLDRVAGRDAAGAIVDFGAGAAPHLPPTLPPELSGGDALPAERALLRFLTPTRMKVRGRLVGGIDFRGFAFAVLRRALELAWFHVPGAEIDWTFRPYLERAGAVRVVADDLAWRDWRRYSNRQEREMTLGGFLGTVELAGDLRPFVPLLRAAEVLHVGKGATFGLGRVRVEG